ncbi:amidohydrolase [Caulobacter sp. 17J65-9]|uniref:amidohydrolase n=1 Tax=Caulobacter sp. 17J65-9 TaxID=2709382 RepID=UPI0013CAA3A3|nr:amidohydrolase [Caulobacter sp. 17J65-9]NEX94565.1 amidohydrolase [Caulobacter sp. 17J65-9]
MRTTVSVLALAGLLWAGAASAAEAPADLVFWGGPIHTADDAHPTAQAVAVRGGRIAYVGDRKGAQAFVGAKTRVVDLKGAALFPGFTDAHAHLYGIGQRELTLNLEGIQSAAALAQAVKAHADKTPGTGPVLGRGWIETHWPEKRFPTRQDLDAVVADRPVVLVRADGHAMVANSAALKLAGVDRNTKAPSGGDILKDANGEPTGMLIDAAMSLMSALAQQPTPEEMRRTFQAGFKVYSEYGWTGLHNMSVPWDQALMLEDFAKAGELPLRVYNAVTPEAGKMLLAGGPRDAADSRVVTRTIKFYADGALGSRGAALFEKYHDADTTGLVQMKAEDVVPVYEEALRKGIQVATHAIGDRGNSLVLDWYAQAFAEVPTAERKVAEPRWRVEHAQILTPADIARFPALHVIPSMQPSHAIGDLHFAPSRLGEERLAGAYAWKSLIAAGAIVPAGSDAPVERGDPRIEFYAAVARKDLSGFSAPDWHPEQAVDRETALKMFTLWPAYASFAEKDLGSIVVGKRADFSVFDVDLMTVPEAAIPKAKALMTVVDGKTAFRAPGW